MNLYTIRSFSKAIRYGSKYVYQTVPRLLTIWLDLGEDKTTAPSEHFKKLNELVATAIREAPAYKVIFLVYSYRHSYYLRSGLLLSLKLSPELGIQIQKSINISPG